MKSETVEWDEIKSLCERLSDIIYSVANGRRIELIGIARGGVIVSTMVSYILSRRYAMDVHFTMIGMRRYDDEGKPADLPEGSECEIYYGPKLLGRRSGAYRALVDEITATGVTFHTAKAYLKNTFGVDAESYCLFATNPDLCDFHLRLIDRETWLYLPWDEPGLEVPSESDGGDEGGLPQVPVVEGQAEAAGG